jgi:mannose-6-phosphate isomerase-like protein (cupin superfamily)
MQIVRAKDLNFVPASHEDIKDPGCLKKVLYKRGDLADGNLQMINWTKLPIGKAFDPHYHESMSEIFIILNGQVEMEVDKDKEILSKGDMVIIPAKAVHVMRNICSEDVNYIAMGIAHEEGGKTIRT